MAWIFNPFTGTFDYTNSPSTATIGGSITSGQVAFGDTTANNIKGTANATLDASGNLTAASFIKIGGTSSQFLKADGSVDSNTYLTSVASISALSITNTGLWQYAFPFLLTPPNNLSISGVFSAPPSGPWIESFVYTENSNVLGPLLTSLTFDDLVGVRASFTPSAMTALTTLSVPALVTVGSNFNPSSMALLTTLSMPVLATVAGSFTPASMAALTTLSIPSLVTVGSNFNPSTMASITTLSAPALTSVGTAFSPNSMASLTTLSVPVLATVGGSLSPANLGALTSLSFPALVTVGAAFIPSTMASITTLSAPALTIIGGSFSPNSMASLTTLSMPVLATVGGSLNPTNLGALTSLSFPALVTVSVAFIPSTMAALTTVSAPALVTVGNGGGAGAINLSTSMGNIANVTFGAVGTTKVIGGNINISGQKLTQSSVDNLLALVASLDGTNGTTLYTSTVNISGGTNAAPTFTGATGTKAGSAFVGVTTTCTVTWVAHGFATGDRITVTGITTLTNANKTAVITVDTADQFHYTIASQSATGAGTATYHQEPAASTEGYANKQRIIINGGTCTTN